MTREEQEREARELGFGAIKFCNTDMSSAAVRLLIEAHTTAILAYGDMRAKAEREAWIEITERTADIRARSNEGEG